MFEYINPGFLILGGFTIFMVVLATILAAGKAYGENKKTNAPLIGSITTVLMIILILSDGYTTKSTIDKNIALFKKGNELQCAALGTTYLVSRGTGWKLHKEAFTKDSILLDARYCEE